MDKGNKMWHKMVVSAVRGGTVNEPIQRETDEAQSGERMKGCVRFFGWECTVVGEVE